MTAPPVDGTHGRFVHQALIYDSDEAFLATAMPFLRGGVAAGETTLLSVHEELERLVLDTVGPLPGLTLLDVENYREPLSTLRSGYDRYAALTRRSSARVRVLAAVPRHPWSGWLRYETAINHLFAPFPLWGVCAYDARLTPDAVLDDVVRSHPSLALADDGAGRVSPRYEDPAGFLNRQACASADALERSPPALNLVDPSVTRARTAVAALAESVLPGGDDLDRLRLSVGEVVDNARRHGRRPVDVSAWTGIDRVVVTVRDAGTGPADPFVGLLASDPDSDGDDANALHLIHHAVSDVWLCTDGGGFMVRLIQRAG